MPSRLREPFGKAGLIVAIVALVASLAGGAIAADLATDSGKRNSKRAKKNKKKKAKGVTVAQVRKISKQEARKFANSNPGAPGLQGPAGAAGAKGDTGAAGSNGKNGTNGTNGADGKTVLSGATAPGTGLGSNGDFYIRTTTSEIYGPKTSGNWGVPTSLKGADGNPWAVGGTLPVGETETGAWAVTGDGLEGTDFNSVPISFSIPLGAEIGAANTHFIKLGDPIPTGCTGGTPAQPKADSGHLCVYSFGSVNNLIPVTILKAGAPGFGASRTGAFATLKLEDGATTVSGTWAVTG